MPHFGPNPSDEMRHGPNHFRPRRAHSTLPAHEQA
jgi:hypothetical protein